QCSAILAEFRRNDALLSQLAPVIPDPALRERIFSSPEFLELTGTFDTRGEAQEDWTVPRLPSKYPRRDTPGRPHLVAIPGGRSTSPNPAVTPPAHTPLPASQRRKAGGKRGLRGPLVAMVAAMLVALGIGGLLSLNLW